ncbi:MAG: radical SAM protein [Pseudomonadota bacterium]|nr:radical SAM protein [Pseudomonadota bacterium]
MHVFIIVPRFKETDELTRIYTPMFIPLGLAYISATLKRAGIKTSILNLNLCRDAVEERIKQSLSREDYRLVLTGGLSVHYKAVKRCVESIRKHAPQAKIVLGGGLISSQPELMWEHLRPDYLVIGEGEEAIVDIVKCCEQNEEPSIIDGIGYASQEGELILTRSRSPIENIDALPWPDYESIGLDAVLDQMLPSQSSIYDVLDHPRAYPLTASRSCPYQCTFCFHPIGNKYRQRSITNVMEELRHAHNRYRFNIIDVYDELFSRDKQRVLEFCKSIKDLSRELKTEIKWNCQMRVDTTDEELMESMKDAGLHCLSLGLESYSQKVLTSMKKRIKPSQIDKSIKTARQSKVAITGNFIFGDRAETLETANETLDYWKKNHDLFGTSISLGFIEPYPGTALYRHCLSKGLITDEIDFVENHIFDYINMSEIMTAAEFEQLKRYIHQAYLIFEKKDSVCPSDISFNNGEWEVRVRCPYCGKESLYRNYIPPSEKEGRRHIYCRHCKIRFFLLPHLSSRGKIRRSLIRVGQDVLGDTGMSYLRKIYRKFKRNIFAIVG